MYEPPTGNYRSDAQQSRFASQAPAPPPARPPRRQRAPYSRRQKLIMALALVVALVAALPLGAYAVLKLAPQSPAQITIPPFPTPTATATPNATQREAQFIDQMIAGMSLDEELGQMVMGAFLGSTLSPDLQTMIVDDHIGSVILYAGNMLGSTQLKTLDTNIQARAQIPLFIATDQEGGTVNRLQSIAGDRPSAEQIGDTNDPNQAKQQGISDGQILSQLGINLNLAPVVDVQNVSDAVSPLPTRMYGNTPQKVIDFAGAYLKGLQSQGVIGSLKHWPGLGDVTVDPHAGLPIQNRSQTDLNNIDFAPYKALIAAGQADMILTTYVTDTAYDANLPGALSRILIDQVLRGALGYEGVVITDGLHMGAISNRWTAVQAAVLAVEAGDDILLSFQADELPGLFQALHDAMNSGQITQARIDQSVERILALKIKYGLLKVPATIVQG